MWASAFNSVRMCEMNRTLPLLSTGHSSSHTVAFLNTSFLRGSAQTGTWPERKEGSEGSWNFVFWGRTQMIWPEENSGTERVSMEECVAASRVDGPEGGGVACKIRSRGVAGVHVLQAGSPEPGVHPILKELLLDPHGASGHQGSCPCGPTGPSRLRVASRHERSRARSPPTPTPAIWARRCQKHTGVPCLFPRGPPLPPQQPPVGSWTP